MNQKLHIPCLWMRGGTSKGLFFLENDLPADPQARDRLLLKAMGSPDARQIDGLGGGTSVTSKAAVIGVSRRPDADVDYTFAQVSVDKPLVSYMGNCGNILSAVGPFAIERGLVKQTEPVTRVRIHNVNTGKLIEAEVAVENGSVKYEGDYAIAGVKGTASPVKLKFLDPSGSVFKRLLPTGRPVEWLPVHGLGKVRVSVVDAANPLVFVMADEIGLKGTESPAALEQDKEILKKLEAVRGAAAVKLGLTGDPLSAAWDCPGIPKLAVIAPAMDYETAGGERILGAQVDLLVRMMSMQKPHPSIAMTGAMCTAAASVVEGSLVWQAAKTGNEENCGFKKVLIGHGAGIMEAGVDYEGKGAAIRILDTVGFRTANLLMEGNVYCV